MMKSIRKGKEEVDRYWIISVPVFTGWIIDSKGCFSGILDRLIYYQPTSDTKL